MPKHKARNKAVQWLLAGAKPQAVEILKRAMAARCPPCAVAIAKDAPLADQRALHQWCQRWSIHHKITRNPRSVWPNLSSLDLILTCRFNRLPAAIWQSPRWGSFNIHNSLLPHYRGVHPLTWAMIHQAPQFGVTLHGINQCIDQGPIIMQQAIANDGIQPFWEVQKILDRHGAVLALHLLNKIRQSKKDFIKGYSQPQINGFYARQRKSEDSRIQWNWSETTLEQFNRALPPPYPAPYCLRPSGQSIRLTDISAHPIDSRAIHLPIGRVLTKESGDYYVIRAGQGCIRAHSQHPLTVGEQLE